MIIGKQHNSGGSKSPWTIIFIKFWDRTFSKILGFPHHYYNLRTGGSCWKVGAQFTFLPLMQSIFNQFSKFFFLLKACLNCYNLKKWVRNCAPCAPSSAAPESYYGWNQFIHRIGCIYINISIRNDFHSSFNSFFKDNKKLELVWLKSKYDSSWDCLYLLFWFLTQIFTLHK